MAWHWRIRHKLMLGLGLVVGIMALLLAGTFHGMMSYQATMKSISAKLGELREFVDGVRQAVANIDRHGAEAPPDHRLDGAQVANYEPPPSANPPDDWTRLREDLQKARAKLQAYEVKLEESRDRDPDDVNLQTMRDLLDHLRIDLENIKTAAKDAQQSRVSPNLASKALYEIDTVRGAIGTAIDASNQLHDAFYRDLYDRIHAAKTDHTNSMILIVASCVVGVCLLAGFVRFFYQWVLYPIRDLQQGVGRIAQGDFEHRIKVESGDEMEELAAAFNDMTARLSDMYADLARQVNERSRQLVRSERLASVGFLAAGVAHEINNPLASIAFCSEALEGRLQALLPARAASKGAPPANDDDRTVVAKYLKMIQQEAFRCKDITQRLLEFSRGGERRREPADLVELVQSVLDIVQHLQNGKGKQIVLQSIPRLVAYINATEIKSVVLNMIVNALDSMDDGGILTITIAHASDPSVDMAELRFADTGCGMPPEVLENIFEPFFTRSRTGKGTGLGLSISHRVISQHGGEIEAASPGLNGGSTFTVRLPLRPPAEQIKEEQLGHAAA